MVGNVMAHEITGQNDISIHKLAHMAHSHYPKVHFGAIQSGTQMNVFSGSFDKVPGLHGSREDGRQQGRTERPEKSLALTRISRILRSTLRSVPDTLIGRQILSQSTFLVRWMSRLRFSRHLSDALAALFFSTLRAYKVTMYKLHSSSISPV